MRRRGVVFGVLVVVSLLLVVSNVNAIEYNISEKVNKESFQKNVKRLESRINKFFKNKNINARNFNIYNNLIELIRVIIAYMLLVPSLISFSFAISIFIPIAIIYYIIGTLILLQCALIGDWYMLEVFNDQFYLLFLMSLALAIPLIACSNILFIDGRITITDAFYQAKDLVLNILEMIMLKTPYILS